MSSPKKYPFKTEIASKTLKTNKQPLNKNNDLCPFIYFFKQNTKLTNKTQLPGLNKKKMFCAINAVYIPISPHKVHGVE